MNDDPIRAVFEEGLAVQRVRMRGSHRIEDTVQALPRHPHRLPERPGKLPPGQLAHHPPALPGRVRRISQLANQLIAP